MNVGILRFRVTVKVLAGLFFLIFSYGLVSLSLAYDLNIWELCTPVVRRKKQKTLQAHKLKLTVIFLFKDMGIFKDCIAQCD